MNILILVDSYYPNLTMNGIISRNVIEELEKKHNVSVITFKDRYKQSKFTKYKRTKIYRITNNNICIDNYLKSKIYKGEKKIFLFKIALIIKRILFFIKRNWRIIGIDKGICRRIVKSIKQVVKNEKIDVIIPISAPYEMIYSGFKALEIEPTMKLIPMKLDFFAELNDKYYFNILKSKRNIKRMELEKKIIKKSEMYFALDFLKNSFNKIKEEEIKSKIEYFHHPLIKENVMIKNDNNIFLRQANLNMVYTGTLSKYERNPKDFFEILEKLPENIDYAFHVFHRGDCNTIINEYVNKIQNRVYDYGSVNSDIAYTAMANSDILVSIGTLQGNQVAGKTFDYISTGKPIIYIYYNTDDENSKYFEIYPKALCLNMSKIRKDEAAKEILNFCKKIKEYKIDFQEIRKIYNKATPLYVVNKINEYI